MALNPFFLQGSQTEQRLIQELINEQLRMYGVDVTYIPRKIVRKDTILREIQSSKFDDSYVIEAYVNTYEGYSGSGDILTKFGLSIRDELTITISKERFEDFISPFLEGESDDEIILSSRPREGDLVYFPLGQRLFEVKFVEHEDPFYQLGKNYVYQLKCELFEYEDEVIDTSIDEIDTQVQEEGFITTLTLIGSGTTASASALIRSGYVRQLFLNNDGSGYTSTPTIRFTESPLSGGTATAVAITTTRASITSIQEIILTNAGFGYTTNPTIYIENGGGSGAAATCFIEPTQSGVISLPVDNSGSGYALAPSVTISPPVGAGATSSATVNGIGSVTAATVFNGGKYYLPSTTVSVTFSAPSGSGITAKGVAYTNSVGIVTGIIITDSGSGYREDTLTLDSTHSFISGQQITQVNNPTAYGVVKTTTSNSNTLVLTDVQGTFNKIDDLLKNSINISVVPINTSTLYITPSVSIGNSASNKDYTNSGLTTATAAAIISSGGEVTAIRITNTGIGYSSAPTVTIEGPQSLFSTGTYQFNEEVVGSLSGSRARVKDWDDTTNILKVSNTNGTFINGETLVGVASSASFTIKKHERDDIYDKYTQNDEIEEEADLILDFTQSNPFGSY